MTDNSDEISIRALKLISGDLDARNLDRLFTILRFRTYGKSLVREIGDFSCHIEDRDRGPTFRLVNNIHNCMPIFRWMLATLVPEYGIFPKIEEISKAVNASFELENEEFYKKNFKISKKTARSFLTRSLKYLIGVKNAKFPNIALFPMYKENVPKFDDRVLRFILSRTDPNLKFTGRNLSIELAELLNEHFDIKRESYDDIVNCEEFLSIFAVEKMHGRKIFVGKDSVILRIGIYDGCIAIFTALETPLDDSHGMVGHFPIFSTSCNPEKWSHLDVWENESDEPLQLIDGKLSRLLI